MENDSGSTDRTKMIVVVFFLIIIILFGIIFLYWVQCINDVSVKEQVEYPLKELDTNPKDTYVLLRVNHNTPNGATYDIITDYELLWENKETFHITKNESYTTSSNAYIELYKNEKRIDRISYDIQRKDEVNYGTLENAFQPINQYTKIMTLGGKVEESHEYYTIIIPPPSQGVSYYTFVHGKDKEDLEKTKLVGITGEPFEVRAVSEDVIGFKRVDSYLSNQLIYYDTKNQILSKPFTNVWVYKDNLIVYKEYDEEEQDYRIIIADVFDPGRYKKIIEGGFSENKKSLIKVEFIDSDTLFLRYYSNDLEREGECLIDLEYGR